MAATLAPHTLAPYVVVVPSRLAAVRRRPMVYVRRRVLVLLMFVAVVVDATGKTVAELKPGAYQLQLPPGRYKARCLAPTPREQEFLSLSEPVTVNVDCG